MSFHRYTYVAYGVHLPDSYEHRWEETEEQLRDTGTHVKVLCQATNPVYLLVVSDTVAELEPGEHHIVFDDDFHPHLDETLDKALAVIQTTPSVGSGWLLMLDES